jgi:hypothetical protein
MGSPLGIKAPLNERPLGGDAGHPRNLHHVVVK